MKKKRMKKKIQMASQNWQITKLANLSLTLVGKVTNYLYDSVSIKMAERSEAKKREAKLCVQISFKVQKT